MTPVDAWATAADLARLYNVTRGTIHRWASEDRWRRRGRRPKRYNWEDAQTSWERRHQGDWQHYAARPDE